MKTRFASPERSSNDLINVLFKKLNEVPIVQELLDKTTDIMFVLDKNRQVVFTNKTFMDFVGIKDINKILGKRPGEALDCVHSEDVSGCGTTEFCVQCGAVKAILTAQAGEEAVEECLLSVKGGESFELLVVAKPFKYMDYEFTFFTAKDISDAKRKKALEKIFFHDIMNIASGIYSVTDYIKEETIADVPDEMFNLLHQSSSDMIKEINEYRTLLLAERKELFVMMSKVSAHSIIDDALSLYKCAGAKRDVELFMKDGSEDVEFKSDPALLSRVLVNMIKNALEASVKGGKVTVWSEESGNRVMFNVHNQCVIPDDVQKQIFKRTFTTKSGGSGLGTYSMKLLSEKYLGGEVSFVSNNDVGTIFKVSFPIGIEG